MDFHNFFGINVFQVKESISDIPTELLVWVTSKIQVNFRYSGYLKVLMIVSHKFLKFLHYLCFRGQGIHF